MEIGEFTIPPKYMYLDFSSESIKIIFIFKKKFEMGKKHIPRTIHEQQNLKDPWKNQLAILLNF